MLVRAVLLLEALKEDPFLLLPASGVPWLVAASLISAFVFTRPLLCPYCVSLLTLAFGLGLLG